VEATLQHLHSQSKKIRMTNSTYKLSQTFTVKQKFDKYIEKQQHVLLGDVSGLSSTTSAPDERFKLFDKPLTSNDKYL